MHHKNSARGSIALVADCKHRSVERLDSGQPYFFAWSPDSDRLLVHAENRRLYYLGLDGSRTDVDRQPGSFSAPQWLETSQLYPIVENEEPTLAIFDDNGDLRRRIATVPVAVAFGFSADGDRVAYIPVGDGATTFVVGPLLVETDGEVTEVAEEAAAFFWSPVGDGLLYLTDASTAESSAVRWNLWDGEQTTPFEPFVPTGTFLQAYLPFFGQYANSLTFLSPDGTSFTFTGTIEGRGEGVWVQEVAGESPARLVAEGVFSTWSPR